MTDELLTSRVARYVHFDQLSRPYLQWQLERFLPVIGQRVLEVGCGVGSIIELLGHREFICGIDVEQDVLDYAAKRFPQHRFLRHDFAQAPVDALRAMRFDTIVSLNVLEHIEDDVAALRAMREILTPGGHAALLVPAHPSLYGEYDRLDGHFRRYTRASFEDALRRAGFENFRVRYFNALGAFGWWVKYKLLRRSIHGSGEFGLMNAAIPLLRPLERLIPPPFGLSLTAIVTR
ncbi:MAG TPA: class I SAM-dependent methyltransferase [Thermoanaerobaculia bacterium]|nr:class I SAM-dependent methyltransferase [Thermoanaerobaculia bacterium]